MRAAHPVSVLLRRTMRMNLYEAHASFATIARLNENRASAPSDFLALAHIKRLQLEATINATGSRA